MERRPVIAVECAASTTVRHSSDNHMSDCQAITRSTCAWPDVTALITSDHTKDWRMTDGHGGGGRGLDPLACSAQWRTSAKGNSAFSFIFEHHSLMQRLSKSSPSVFGIPRDEGIVKLTAE
jgi:hypothetical protein